MGISIWQILLIVLVIVLLFGAGKLPRTVNMISGPSRTADVEQTIQLGAHGPRRLHIVVVGAG